MTPVDECQAYELAGAYSFHGHGAHLTLAAGNCTTGTTGGQARVVSLHSKHGVHLFRFTGGASIHARGIGFQVGGCVCSVCLIVGWLVWSTRTMEAVVWSTYIQRSSFHSKSPFKGGTGKWGGAVELSGEGRDSDSDFDG